MQDVLFKVKTEDYFQLDLRPFKIDVKDKKVNFELAKNVRTG